MDAWNGSGPKIEDFVASVTPDLYVPTDLANWSIIERDIAGRANAMHRVALLALGPQDKARIAEAILEDSGVYDVICRLLSLSVPLGFVDGRDLPGEAPRDIETAAEVADVFTEVGVWRLLETHTDVESLLRVALIASGAPKRRFNVRRRLQTRAAAMLKEAMAIVTASEPSVRVRNAPVTPPQLSGLDYVFVDGEHAFAGLKIVYQAKTGGRQQRDLQLTYPAVQRQMDALPAGLIVIADGRGLKRTPRRVLTELFKGVATVLTLQQAERGGLAAAILALRDRGGVRPGITAPLEQLIASSLEIQGGAAATDLPAPVDEARLAIARFATEHGDLALEVGPGGSTISWVRRDLVILARKLAQAPAPRAGAAISLFTALLDLKTSPADGVMNAVVVNSEGDLVLPPAMLVVADDEAVTTQRIRAVASDAMRVTPDAGLAVLLVPEVRQEQAFRMLQAALSTSVVVVSYADLLGIARGGEAPRDGLVDLIRRRGDVAKVSPFVERGATPSRVFYGRDAELATVMTAVTSQSVALLGSRRIGKTSLLKKALASISESGFEPYYADVQAVGSWTDFGLVAARSWHTTPRESFTPQDLPALIEELRSIGRGPPVVILDEVDHLLRYDESQMMGGVREAFFRTCRAISQEGRAQFVFAGERTIALKLWDPQSPHWNFCQPLSLRQLDRPSTEALIAEPLRALRLRIGEQDTFLQEVWRHTSGHPQITQYLGNTLVSSLNDSPADGAGVVSPSDLLAIVNTFSFAEHYLETYWGQATDLERLTSAVVAGGVVRPHLIAAAVRKHLASLDEEDLVRGLRMLELYGVIDREENGFLIRPEWFGEALGYYGGPEIVANRYGEKLSRNA